MSFSDQDRELFRQIITDHYQHPRNKGLLEDERYITVRLKNPSCGDDLTVQLLIEQGEIKDVRQLGDGCSICCSSASMMSELLRDKPCEEAHDLIDRFRQMVRGEDVEVELLEDAQSLSGVAQLPPRINCAILAWQAAERALAQQEGSGREVESPEEIVAVDPENGERRV